MQSTPKGMRIQIAIFGRRNVGKSSILNALTQQDVSIVSNIAGTTTDPVEKAMELLPIGPVLFIDTAGLDDLGKLGKLRIDKTYEVFNRADIILLVTEANVWSDYEEKVLKEARKRNTHVLTILNKVDLNKTSEKIKGILDSIKVPSIESSIMLPGWEVASRIKDSIIKMLPLVPLHSLPLIADLIDPEDHVVLVIPIDKEAPKGRIILPQQQTLRELLDIGAVAIVLNEKKLKKTISNLATKPKIVITDSQVFKEVFEAVPSDIFVTSFSILFARAKGDLKELVGGSKKIDRLKIGDKVLIAEACTHHPIGDDIGRVKIPGWINNRVRGKIEFNVFSGHDFPEDLQQYKLIIHCGSCMLNRKETLHRVNEARRQGVPITNYGVAISFLFGNLDRALKIFGYSCDNKFLYDKKNHVWDNKYSLTST